MKASGLVSLLNKAIKKYGNKDVVTRCQFNDIGEVQGVQDIKLFGSPEYKFYGRENLIVINTLEK